MESSLFGGLSSTHINMCEWRKLSPEVFLWVWGSEGSCWRVRNRVFDEESNSSIRTRLRSVIPEEGVTSERY